MTPTYRCGHPRTAGNTVGIKHSKCRECSRENAHLRRARIDEAPVYSRDPMFSARAVDAAVAATGWSKRFIPQASSRSSM